MLFTDLETEIKNKFKLPSGTARLILKFILKRMREKLLFGESIFLGKIGTFKIVKKEPKKYKDFFTKKEMVSPKSYGVVFKVAPSLTAEMKKKTVY